MSKKITRTRIEEIKRLAKEATQVGPWSLQQHKYGFEVVSGSTSIIQAEDEDDLAPNVDDLAFIAATDPQTVLALIEQLEAWREAALEMAALWNGHHGQTIEMAERALARARSLEREGGEFDLSDWACCDEHETTYPIDGECPEC